MQQKHTTHPLQKHGEKAEARQEDKNKKIKNGETKKQVYQNEKHETRKQ